MSISVAAAGYHHRLHPGRSDVPAGDADTPSGSAASAIDASGSSTAASLLSLLGRLGATEPESTATSIEAATVKPNLDALNRVLAHYAAQSAAVETVVSLVKS